MRSKALVRFLNRAARFDTDIELVDVLCVAAEAGDLTPVTGEPLLAHIDPVAHPRLAKAKVTDHNRQLVIGHLRKTVYVSYIKDLYEDFGQYLDELIISANNKGLSPHQLRGEHRLLLSADEILESGSWDNVLGVIAESLQRRLDTMGNVKKLAFLDKKLGLELDHAVVTPAMSFLDLRHLLVHADGTADAAFCEKYPSFRARPGESVKVAEGTTRDARAAITSLVEHIDAKAVHVGVLAEADQQ